MDSNRLLRGVADAASPLASRRQALAVMAGMFVALSLPDLRALAETAAADIPATGQANPAIVNYTRVRPALATAGLLKDGAIPALTSYGFKVVLDLRMPEEGTAAEKQQAEAAGLAYHNIPISGGAPTDAQIDAFAQLVEDKSRGPLMIHCASGNRVGAMWTLFRVRKQGVPFTQAAEEGRLIGLQALREAALRQQLGLAPAQ